jgi:hypothetical protein
VDKFVLERSHDLTSGSFNVIGEKIAKGSELGGGVYNFIDNLPEEISYYRLKSLDLDGSSQISKILTLRRDPVFEIQVYPSVTSNEIFIQAPAGQSPGYLKMFNVNGQIVKKEKLTTTKKGIDIEDLSAGIYVLQIIHPNGFKTFKIQKI